MAAQPVTVPGCLLLLNVGGGEAEHSLAVASKPLRRISMHNLLALGRASVKYLASKCVCGAFFCCTYFRLRRAFIVDNKVPLSLAG